MARYAIRSVGSTTARLTGESSIGLRVTHALLGAPSAGGPERPLLRAVDETAPLYGPHRQKGTPSSTHTNVFVRRKSRRLPSSVEIDPPPRFGRVVLSVKMRRAELNRPAAWIPGRRGREPVSAQRMCSRHGFLHGTTVDTGEPGTS